MLTNATSLTCPKRYKHEGFKALRLLLPPLRPEQVRILEIPLIKMMNHIDIVNLIIMRNPDPVISNDKLMRLDLPNKTQRSRSIHPQPLVDNSLCINHLFQSLRVKLTLRQYITLLPQILQDVWVLGKDEHQCRE